MQSVDYRPDLVTVVRKREELTEEEKRLLAEKAERKKNRDTAVSILRGISIRMPLLIYGADVSNEDEEIAFIESMIKPME